MRRILIATLLLSSSFLLAQGNASAQTGQHTAKDSKGEITVQGCVERASGDYILMRQDPAVTYELQATGKTKLHKYLGQQVEITGTESPSMSTSSDTSARAGSPSPVTLTITSIATIGKECTTR
jgi:hypothetical protein